VDFVLKGSVYGADLKNEDHMHIENLPLEELRKKWAKAWNLEPHRRIGRKMLQRRKKWQWSLIRT